MKKLLFLIIILPFNIFALTYPDLNSKKVLIYDKTDDLILYEKNADEKSYIASITKIATSMAAIEEIKDYIRLNPLYIFIHLLRELVLYGRVPGIGMWAWAR